MLNCGEIAVGVRPSKVRPVCDSCASGGFKLKLLKRMCQACWWCGSCCHEADVVRLIVRLRDCSVTFFVPPHIDCLV